MKKINERGFSHDIVLVMFVVIFALAGVAYLVASHADPTSPSSGVTSGTTTYLNGKIFSGNYSLNSDGTNIAYFNTYGNPDNQTTQAAFGGGRIAYLSTGSINVADVPFANPRSVATTPTYDNLSSPVWSINGVWLASAYRNPSNPKGWGIWLAKSDGTASHKLSNFPTKPFNQYISWVPNISSIMYTPYGDGSAAASKLCTISILGTNNTCVPIQLGNVSVHSVLGASGLSVSPNSQKVAIVAFNHTGIAGVQPSSDIYTVNPNGSGLKQLTDFPAGEQVDDVVWSPDNTKLAYTFIDQNNLSSTGPSGLYVMNADGSGAVKINGGVEYGAVYSNSLAWAKARQ